MFVLFVLLCFAFKMYHAYCWTSVACLTFDCELLLCVLSMRFADVFVVIHAYALALCVCGCVVVVEKS